MVCGAVQVCFSFSGVTSLFALFGCLTTYDVECDGSWLGGLYYKVHRLPCYWWSCVQSIGSF